MARMIRQKVRDMKNYKIAEVLKEYRKKNDLSVTQVSNILKEHNKTMLLQKPFMAGKVDIHNQMQTL